MTPPADLSLSIGSDASWSWSEASTRGNVPTREEWITTVTVCGLARVVSRRPFSDSSGTMAQGARKAVALAVLTVLCTAALIGAPSASATDTACPNPDTPSAQLDMQSFESSVICLINEQRAAFQMKPLRPNGLLQDAAWIYVTSELSGEFFGHYGSVDGRNNQSSPIKRLRFLGYIPPGKRWIVGEDLRQAPVPTDTPDGVVQAWMNSPPHRQRILKAKFEDIGLSADPGIADSFPVTSGVTVAAEFGFRRFPK
jgi:uncharacterized protein YkwD